MTRECGLKFYQRNIEICEGLLKDPVNKKYEKQLKREIERSKDYLEKYKEI